MRRQPASEIDASTIEQLAAGCESDEHGGVAVLSDTDSCRELSFCSVHLRSELTLPLQRILSSR
jgi:hypothetical protein